MVLGAFVQHRELVVIDGDDVVEADLTAGEHVACYITAGALGVYVAREDCAHRHSRQDVVILLAVRQRTGQRHFLLVIDDTFLEETADDGEVLDVDGEDRLTLCQRREVVELYAYVSGRVRTEDLIEGAVLQLAELGSFSTTFDTDEYRCDLAQRGDSCL